MKMNHYRIKNAKSRLDNQHQSNAYSNQTADHGKSMEYITARETLGNRQIYIKEDLDKT
jgi:hypothetical protein